MILFLSAVAFNAGITLAISYFLTKIRLESKAKAAMILVVYFSEIACEALLLTFFRNEIRTFLAKIGFEPVFFFFFFFFEHYFRHSCSSFCCFSFCFSEEVFSRNRTQFFP